MSSPNLAQILAIVEAALALDAEERDAYVLAASMGDPAVLAAVRAALAAEPPDGFVEPPTDDGRGGAEQGLTALVGTRIGDFELREEIGRGGMGVVFRARQLSLDREVAVKVLPAIRRRDQIAYERFRREAFAASRLQHDALVPVLAIDADDERAWYAMPYVVGHDLHLEIAAQASADVAACLLPRFGSPAYEVAVALQVARLADGLQHAHASGVIHRDVKPRNIIVTRDGRMVLTDFGLARIDGGETLTASDAVQGTPHYMSPEQARALEDPVTERTDVYSLGVVLYELLTRQKPFQAEDLHAVLRQIASGTHQRLRRVNTRVPRDLATICEKAMAHRPADRYASAGELADDLGRFVRRESIAARPMPLFRRAWRWTQRRPWRVALASAAVILAVASWTISVAQGRAAERRAALGPLQRLVDAEEPTDAQLASAWRALGALERTALDRSDGAIAARAEERLRADIAERALRIQRGIDAALGARPDPRFDDGTLVAPDSAPMFEALLLAEESAALYPGEPRIEALAGIERVLPIVSIDVPEDVARGVSGRVLVQRLDRVTDVLTGASVLGTLPLTDVRIAAGSYRFTVVLDDGRFAELERDLELRPDEHAWVARPRSDAEIEATMVRIDGDFPAAAERADHCHVPVGGLGLASFWIAATELSNGEFVRFLRETGTAAPSMWLDAGFDSERGALVGDALPSDFDQARWLQLPVTLVDYGALRDCAEWYGCRVPQHLELEFAQRGPGLDLRPAPFDPDAAASFNTAGDLPRVPGDALGILLLPTRWLQPVDLPAARTRPFGLYHTLGNVSEWTSSRAVVRNGDVLSAVQETNYVLGSSWFADKVEGDLASHATSSTHERSKSPYTGLRLARSVLPPAL